MAKVIVYCSAWSYECEDPEIALWEKKKKNKMSSIAYII